MGLTAVGAGARGRARARGRWRILVLVVLLTALVGCTQPTPEPGLFGRENQPSSTAPPTPETPPRSPQPIPTQQRQNPELPVVGEAVWTTADGSGVELRIAVHAVRRLPGATVLDWSVTPLRAPGLAVGDAVPGSVDLGLTQPEYDSLNVFLVDAPASRVFRPLTTSDFDDLQNCLCSPVRLAERRLRIGSTQLLQIAFPALPAATATVDVDIATVPIFWRVPVTPVGMVPRAATPVDLARSAGRQPQGPWTPRFSYGPGRQQFVMSVEQVTAASTFTSLRWTIRSVTAGAGMDVVTSTPFSAGAVAGEGYNVISASGPEIRPAGRGAGVSRTRRMSSGSPLAPVKCLCSDLRAWATALRSAGQQASVVTNFAALSPDIRRVDVLLPGLTTIKGVQVTRATDASTRSAAPVRRSNGTWTYGTDPPAGWTADQWPTPLPDVAQLPRFDGDVIALLQ
jgi:hypothetical protein